MRGFLFLGRGNERLFLGRGNERFFVFRSR